MVEFPVTAKVPAVTVPVAVMAEFTVNSPTELMVKRATLELLSINCHEPSVLD